MVGGGGFGCSVTDRSTDRQTDTHRHKHTQTHTDTNIHRHTRTGTQKRLPDGVPRALKSAWLWSAMSPFIRSGGTQQANAARERERENQMVNERARPHMPTQQWEEEGAAWVEASVWGGGCRDTNEGVDGQDEFFLRLAVFALWGT